MASNDYRTKSLSHPYRSIPISHQNVLEVPSSAGIACETAARNRGNSYGSFENTEPTWEGAVESTNL